MDTTAVLRIPIRLCNDKPMSKSDNDSVMMYGIDSVEEEAVTVMGSFQLQQRNIAILFYSCSRPVFP